MRRIRIVKHRILFWHEWRVKGWVIALRRWGAWGRVLHCYGPRWSMNLRVALDVVNWEFLTLCQRSEKKTIYELCLGPISGNIVVSARCTV